MILGARRLFRSLARYHHAMIIITILVPFIWSVIIPFLVPDCLVLQVILYAAAFTVLLVSAELSVAFALKRDRSNAERFVSQEVEVVAGEIRTMRAQLGALIEQQGDFIKDLQQHLDDLDNGIRSAFEELGVVLPARRVPLRARAIFGSATMSAPTLCATGGSKWRRLIRLFQRFVRWLKETVWGQPDHH